VAAGRGERRGGVLLQEGPLAVCCRALLVVDSFVPAGRREPPSASESRRFKRFTRGPCRCSFCRDLARVIAAGFYLHLLSSGVWRQKALRTETLVVIGTRARMARRGT